MSPENITISNSIDGCMCAVSRSSARRMDRRELRGQFDHNSLPLETVAVWWDQHRAICPLIQLDGGRI